MSRVQQRAGGGKVMVEGLEAENVKKGATVTVKQGSKTIKNVTGTYIRPTRKVLIGSWTPTNEDSYGSGWTVTSRSFDVKSKLPNDYHKLTAADFVVENNGHTWVRMDAWIRMMNLPWPSVSGYNAQSGVVTVANTTVNGPATAVLCYGINVYAVLNG